jgi:hypothetical protein
MRQMKSVAIVAIMLGSTAAHSQPAQAKEIVMSCKGKITWPRSNSLKEVEEELVRIKLDARKVTGFGGTFRIFKITPTKLSFTGTVDEQFTWADTLEKFTIQFGVSGTLNTVSGQARVMVNQRPSGDGPEVVFKEWSVVCQRIRPLY